MFGGDSLLGLMARGNTWLTPFRLREELGEASS
jgi:hypothetical protein